MNKVLQTAEMVLSVEQCELIVNPYYETHLLKRVHNNFLHEFPNSVSPSTHTVLNLILKNQKQTYTR